MELNQKSQSARRNALGVRLQYTSCGSFSFFKELSFFLFFPILLSILSCNSYAFAEENGGLPIAAGEVLASKWIVTNIERQPEYVRFFFKYGDVSSAVEVVYNQSQKPSRWATHTYKVQPIAGESADNELFLLVRNLLQEWESDPEHKPFINKRIDPLLKQKSERGISQKLRLDNKNLAATTRDHLTKTISVLRWVVYSIFLYLTFVLFSLKFSKRLSLRNVEATINGHFHLLNHVLFSIGRFLIFSFGFRYNYGDNLSSWNPRERRRSIAIGLILGLITTLVLVLLDFKPPLFDDTFKYLIWGKDCFLLNNCFQTGPQTGFRTITMGALPIYFFAFCQKLGLSIGQIHLWVNVTYGISVSLCYWISLIFLSRRSAVFIALFLLPFSLFMMNYPILWNLSVSFLPVLLVHLFVFLLVRRGSGIYAVLAAVFLYSAVEMHIVNSILFPALILVTILFSKRPVWVTIATVFVFVELSLYSSYSANMENLKWFASEGYLSYIGLIFLVIVVTGWGFRSRIQDHHRDVGPMVFTGGVTIFVCFALFGLAVIERRYFFIYYLQPVIPGLAVMAARLTMLVTARLASLLQMQMSGRYFFRSFALAIPLLLSFSYLYLLASGVFVTEAKTRWNMQDVERVSGYLYEKGYTYSELCQRVRTVSQPYFAKAMLLFEPEPMVNCQKRVDDKRDLLILKVSKKTLPKKLPKDITLLSSNRGRAIVILPIEPWLSRQNVQIRMKYFDFYEAHFDDGEKTSEEIDYSALFTNISMQAEDCKTASSTCYISRWQEKLYPSTLNAIHQSGPFNLIQAYTFRMSLTPKGEDSSRYFLVLGEYDLGGWFFDAVDNATIVGRIPSKVILVQNSLDQKGTLDTTYYMNNSYNDFVRYPSVLEIPTQYNWLLEALADVYPRITAPLSRLKRQQQQGGIQSAP